MLNVGFSNRKNVQTALKAWSKINKKNPGAVLVAAGPGYEHGGEAHLWAMENHLDADVEFIGSVSATDVPQWFASLDAFLHPSLEESFGMVLVEAMAAGIPVIAGRDSGAVPVITGGHALLTNVSSATDIATTLTRVINDARLRHALSTAGLHWSKKFAIQESAKMFLDHLTTLRTSVRER